MDLAKGGLGYDIRAERLSPHNFGIPQIRERVYIVGSLGSLSDFVWPQPGNAITNIDSVLDKKPADAKRVSPQVKECLEVWDEFLKACPAEVELPSFPLWSMEWGATYPFETTTPFALKKLRGMAGLKGFRGSHGCKVGTLKVAERALECAAEPCPHRGHDLS